MGVNACFRAVPGRAKSIDFQLSVSVPSSGPDPHGVTQKIEACLPPRRLPPRGLLASSRLAFSRLACLFEARLPPRRLPSRRACLVEACLPCRGLPSRGSLASQGLHPQGLLASSRLLEALLAFSRLACLVEARRLEPCLLEKERERERETRPEGKTEARLNGAPFWSRRLGCLWHSLVLFV